MMAKAKTLKEKIDALPTTKYAVYTAIITFLGTGAGMKCIDRFFPDTRSAMESLASDQRVIQRDIESIKKAMWKQFGIRVTPKVEEEE